MTNISQYGDWYHEEPKIVYLTLPIDKTIQDEH